MKRGYSGEGMKQNLRGNCRRTFWVWASVNYTVSRIVQKQSKGKEKNCGQKNGERKLVLQPSSSFNFWTSMWCFFCANRSWRSVVCCERAAGSRVFLFVQYLSTLLDKSILNNCLKSWVDPDLWICNDLCMLSFSVWQVNLCMLLFGGRSGGC